MTEELREFEGKREEDRGMERKREGQTNEERGKSSDEEIFLCVRVSALASAVNDYQLPGCREHLPNTWP